jgi:hypothetical protein
MTDRHMQLLIFTIIICTINGYISTEAITSNNKIHTNIIHKLQYENGMLADSLESFKEYGIEVDVTMYQPVYPQTDITPNITADGTKFNTKKASEYRWVALSRNLLKRWGGEFDYGDFVLIKGTTHKDGVYQVKDTMNARFVNVVDILESITVMPYRYDDVQLFKLNWIN